MTTFYRTRFCVDFFSDIVNDQIWLSRVPESVYIHAVEVNLCDVYCCIFIFSTQSFQECLVFLQPFIAPWITWIWLTAAKLTCPCDTLWTTNSFARSDTSAVIDNEPHPSSTCKTSLLFAPLAVHLHTGCSTFLCYTPTKPLIQLHAKYKTVLFPKSWIFSIVKM